MFTWFCCFNVFFFVISYWFRPLSIGLNQKDITKLDYILLVQESQAWIPITYLLLFWVDKTWRLSVCYFQFQDKLRFPLDFKWTQIRILMKIFVPFCVLFYILQDFKWTQIHSNKFYWKSLHLIFNKKHNIMRLEH